MTVVLVEISCARENVLKIDLMPEMQDSLFPREFHATDIVNLVVNRFWEMYCNFKARGKINPRSQTQLSFSKSA